jgi:putative hemolysin
MITLHVLLILCFLVLHAFFAGIETGIISINRLRLHHYLRKGSNPARILQTFVENFDRLLGTTLVGTNFCVVMNSVLAASLALETGLPGAQATSSVLIALLVIVFCEYLPKAWFQARPFHRSKNFANALLVAEWVLRPFSVTIITIAKWLSPGERTFHRPTSLISRDDLKVLAREGEIDGVLSSKERYMIHRVIELSSTHVSQIMTPIQEMIAVQDDMSLAQLYEVARKTGLTRFPVRNKTGEFTGIVNACYILSLAGAQATGTVAAYARPLSTISADTKVDAILPMMRRTRQPMCLVRQDQEVVGLVTTEDVLRVIVGKL